MSDIKKAEVKLTDKSKYYTIPQIIEQAKVIFDFDFSAQTDNGRLYEAIDKQIRRKLKGKPTYGDGMRNRKYARKDVYRLLSKDLYSYFSKISMKKNKRDVEKFDKVRQSIADERQQAQAKVADSSRTRKRITSEYNSSYASFQDEELQALIRHRDGTLNNDDVKLHEDFDTDKMKRKIFFEFLYECFFDYFIDFNEDQYREDWRNKPEADSPVLDDAEALAAARLADSHNYYRLKLSLDEIRNLLQQLGIKINPNA